MHKRDLGLNLRGAGIEHGAQISLVSTWWFLLFHMVDVLFLFIFHLVNVFKNHSLLRIDSVLFYWITDSNSSKTGRSTKSSKIVSVIGEPNRSRKRKFQQYLFWEYPSFFGKFAARGRNKKKADSYPDQQVKISPQNRFRFAGLMLLSPKQKHISLPKIENTQWHIRTRIGLLLAE